MTAKGWRSSADRVGVMAISAVDMSKVALGRWQGRHLPKEIAGLRRDASRPRRLCSTGRPRRPRPRVPDFLMFGF